MLRITLTASDSALFVLEGKLAGLWAKELLRVTRQAGVGPTSVFDLEEVFCVDTLGEQALQALSRLGARFITESAYGKDLCEHLKLHRIKRSYVEGCSTPQLQNGSV